MKINFINEHCLYWNGGIRYIFEMTRRLAKEHEVSLTVQAISEKNEKMFRDANVQVLDLETITPSKLKYWLFYPYYLVKHAMMLMKAQMVYQFDVWISSSPTTHIQCMMAGIKPIIVVFELNPWLYSSEYQRGLSSFKRFIIRCGGWLAKNLERAAYWNASKIIVYSKYIQSEVKRVYGVESEVVYTGVDSDFFKPTHNPEIENRYKGKQVILHVASYLSPMKGTDLAVEAMGIVNLPNALLVIVNSNNNIDRQYELHDKANQCGANIEFVTDIKDTDLPVYYTMAKCLLSPSLDENVHLPVLEAGACGTPTICLRGKTESEDVLHRVTGIVAYDAQAMAYWIQLASETKEEFGNNARRYIKSKFSWDESVSEYERIIGEVNGL